MTTRQQAEEILRRIGTLPDEDIDLAEGALALAVREQSEPDLDRYRQHLRDLAREVAEEAAGMEAGNGNLQGRIEALRQVLVERHGYTGDQATYDDLHNANLLRVIDRKRGLPVALGILFIETARAQGWNAVGLNFPGHFLIRLEAQSERAIIDPFEDGRIRTAADLRDLLKVAAGANAELTPEVYQAVGNRDILLRLQNNLKLRLLRAEQPDRALSIIEGMLLIAPEEASLWREAGLLHAHLDNIGAAISALETHLGLADNEHARHQTAMLLQQLKNRLN